MWRAFGTPWLRSMILAIETSCDDTCAAVLGWDGVIAANVISSQMIHDALRRGRAGDRLAPASGADRRRARRGAGSRRRDPRRRRPRRRDPWSGAGRGAARRLLRRQGARRRARAAVRRGRPSPRPRRRELPRAGSVRAAVPQPDRERRTHAARRRSATAHRRRACSARRSTTPPARRSTRVPACSASATRAARRSSGSRARAIPEAFDFPTGASLAWTRLLVRRPEDLAAVQDPRPRRARGRAPPRRPRRLLSAGDRRGADDPGQARAQADGPSSGWRSAAASPPTARCASGWPSSASSSTCPPRALCTDNAAMIASAAR